MPDKLTATELMELYPDIYAEIESAAHARGLIEGTAVGRAEGMTDGASAERTRIIGILALSRPGHETLINAAITDGITTPDALAHTILDAEGKQREIKLAAFRAEHKTTVPAADAAGPEEAAAAAVAAADDTTIPVEQRAKIKWDADKELRSRFQMSPDPFGAYVAYLSAVEKGQVHIFKSGQRPDNSTKGGA